MIIGCLYLPNGNPAPGPKFEYRLRWFERLTQHAAGLLAPDIPVVLAGDYNVIPPELDARKPENWLADALLFPASRDAYHRLVAQGPDAVAELAAMHLQRLGAAQALSVTFVADGGL